MRSSQKKVKILFVHHGKGLGGAPLSLLYLIQVLDKKLYEPIVLFLQDSEVINLYKAHGIQIIGPLHVMDFPHTKIWWLRWYHIAQIVRVVKDTFKTMFFIAPHIFSEVKPDVVHLNTSSLIAWGWAANRQNIPLAWHIREPLATGYFGLRKRIVRHCVKYYANAIIPICHNNALPWCRQAKTKVIYNTVNAKQFDEKLSPKQFLKQFNLDAIIPKILFLGGLSEEKGLHIILEIVTRLHKHLPNVQLLVAGNCSIENQSKFWPKKFYHSARFKNKIQGMLIHLGTSVKLLGTIYDVPAAMASSSVIVFPATVGHFARPIIEAGFMKKPSIASNMAPLDELIIDGKTGFLISPDNYEAWVEKLLLLLKNHDFNNQMGQAAYDFCTAHFNLNIHKTMIEEVYLEILSKESKHDTRTT